MKIFRGRTAWAADPGRPRAPAIAIGNFDGVHLGHRALLDCTQHVKAGSSAGVLTFNPHPAQYFAPHLAPPMIMSLPQRLATLGACGAEFVLVEDFNAALAGLDPETFVLQYLHQELGAASVVVGYDFAFGKGRRGNAQQLKTLGAQVGMNVHIVEPVTVDGLVCSSSKVREFILQGRVEGAALLLGRPFRLPGLVVHGAHRGRTLGYPTANLQPEAELIPRAGIYAGTVWSDNPDGPRGVASAISVGTNPTFSHQGGVSIEAHLLDFQGDLYGTRLAIDFHARLRDEQRFENVEALVAQIAADVERTRVLVRSPANPPPQT